TSRAPLGGVTVPFQGLVARADIPRHGLVETPSIVVHLAQKAMCLPALEDLVAVSVGYVLLGGPNDVIRELSAAARLGEQVRLLQAAEVDVVVKQGKQVLEPAMVLVSLVRRGGQEKQCLAVLLVANFLGQAVIEGLFHLARGVIERAKPMGFIEND